MKAANQSIPFEVNPFMVDPFIVGHFESGVYVERYLDIFRAFLNDPTLQDIHKSGLFEKEGLGQMQARFYHQAVFLYQG